MHKVKPSAILVARLSSRVVHFQIKWQYFKCFIVGYCSDATSHSRGQHTRVRVNIYASDQAKSVESREFTKNYQACKHLINSTIFEDSIE